MGLSDQGTGMYMPVAPAFNGMGGNYGGFGAFGNDWWGILLLIALLNGGFGGFGGFGGGYGAMMGMGMMDGGFGLYPWMTTNQNVNNGFRDQMINDGISAIRGSVTSGFGDVQLGIAGVNQNICQTGNSVVSAVNNGFANAETSANARAMASLQQAYAAQTANMQGMNALQGQIAQYSSDNRLATANLQNVIQTENCADRAAVGEALQNVTMQNVGNTNAIVNAITAGIQSIKDDLCADRLDAERRENANLRSELMYARGQASQVDQTAQIRAAQATTANQLVNELRSCPIPSQPVYGNQPIFTCPGNGCGCGCNS